MAARNLPHTHSYRTHAPIGQANRSRHVYELIPHRNQYDACTRILLDKGDWQLPPSVEGCRLVMTNGLDRGAEAIALHNGQRLRPHRAREKEQCHYGQQ